MSAVFASASVLGPLIGGSLTDHVHWRWVFYVNIPLGMLALTVLWFGMPNIRPSRHDRLDYSGIFLLLFSVVPMLLGFSWAGSRYDWFSWQVLGLFGWAFGGLLAFIYFEMRSDHPLLPLSLFKSRVFSVAALVTLVSGVGMMGSLFYIPLFVQGVIGKSATNSGFVTMPMMISMAVASAITGQVLSRWGRYRIPGVIGLIVAVGGMVLLSRMDVNSVSRDATIAMVVLGAGLGTSIPLYMLAVQNDVPYRLMGVSTSTMQFLRAVGGTMGVAVMFSLIQSHYRDGLAANVPGPVQSAPQLYGAIQEPQFLLNKSAGQEIEVAFASFGSEGPKLFDATIFAVRDSLANSISDTFFISAFVIATAVVIALFIKEIPLKKVHFVSEEGLAPGPAAEEEPVEEGVAARTAMAAAGARDGGAG